MFNLSLLKIPFISKKKYYQLLNIKKNIKYGFEGIAYYLIDENYNIIWQRAKLTNNFEYRPTDNKMLITDYYKKLLKKGVNREAILPFSDINCDVVISTKEQLNLVNNYSFNYTNTVLSLEGFISGSNSSGADKKPNAAPILINPKHNNEYIKFINAFKRIKVKNNKTLFIEKLIKNGELKNFDQLENMFNEISLEKLLNNNQKLKTWMNIINSININENVDKEHIFEKEYISNIEEKDINDNLKESFHLFEMNLIDQEKLIIKLRSNFRKKLIKYGLEKNISEFLGGLNDIFDSEAAHIYDVKDIKNEIKKSNNSISLYKEISDINNGLLLEPSIHKLFDKNKITFNEEGYLISLDSKYKYLESKKINKEVFNIERKQYLTRRNNLHFSEK